MHWKDLSAKEIWPFPALFLTKQQWKNERDTSPKSDKPLHISDVFIVTNGSSSQHSSSEVCTNDPLRAVENMSHEKPL